MQCVPNWSTTICRAAYTVRTNNLLLHCRPCDKPLPTIAPGRRTNYTYIQIFAHPQAGAGICLPDPAMSYAMALHCVTANAAQDRPADMHALCAVHVHRQEACSMTCCTMVPEYTVQVWFLSGSYANPFSGT